MATRPNVMIIPGIMLQKAAQALARDCANCGHAAQIAEHEWDCQAEEYDIDTLSCFEPRIVPGTPLT